MVQVVLGRALVVVGYTVVAVAAVMTPFAYALDLLETLPAIAIALLIIAVGVAAVLLGDKLAESRSHSPQDAVRAED